MMISAIKKRIYGIITGLSFLAFISLPGQADYQPPARRSTPTSPTTTTGRRGGCDGDAEYPLMILAPTESIGRSTSRSPVVIWYVPDQQSHQMQLRLFELRSDGSRQRLAKIELESQKGFMEYQWPEDAAPLAQGKSYRWQVVVFCDRNQPSSAIVAEAMMDIVEPPNVGDRLNAMDKTPETFQQLVQTNRWYDALFVLSQLSDPDLKQQLQEGLLK